MPPTSRANSRHHLEIYVTRGCRASVEARKLATLVASWHISNLDVDVVDLDEPGSLLPSTVFAVPTYLLDGVVLSLGNPAAEELRDQLAWPMDERRCP